MTKCKKLLVMLLGVVCVVAFALGLVACGGGGGETYTVTVTDTTAAKAPVANVWLELYYNETRTVEAGDNTGSGAEIGSTYTVQVTLARTKTDADGVAKFVTSDKAKENLAANEFNPVQNAKYLVQVAEYGELSGDRAVPYNYTLHTETDPATQLPVTYSEFDGNKNAEVKLDYYPNHFYYSKRSEHPYNREYNKDDEAHPLESEDKALQLNVTAGNLSYFDFEPFKNPGTVSTSDINPVTGTYYTDEEASAEGIRIVNMATLAASGKYRLTVSTSTPSATPVMRRFNASAGYTPMNSEGIPTSMIAITGTAPAGVSGSNANLYTGTNYIELDLDLTQSTASYYFYVTANIDCTVTITAERTGDATEREQAETITVQPYTQNLPAFIKEQGLTAVPADGSVTVVKGDDGYYHINSKDGKIIAVMLTKTDVVGDRIGDAINTWTNATVSDVENEKIYDYSALIKFYAMSVNADGVYGLNEDLYHLVNAFATRFAGASTTTPETNWLLPCVYYAEENTPISVGNTDIVYDGSETLSYSFTVAAGGWYVFDTVPSEIEIIEIDGDMFENYIEVPFKAEAGRKYSVVFYIGEDAIVGNTYTVHLSETEAQNTTLTVGNNEVSVDGPNETVMTLELGAMYGTFTLQVTAGAITMQGVSVEVVIGTGPAAPKYVLNSENSYTVNNVTIYAGTEITFTCPGQTTVNEFTFTITAE